MKALRIVAMLLLSGSLIAATDASISGTWVKADKSQPPVGMEFHADGATLTGGVRLGDSPLFVIRDGHIDGSRVTFKAMIREGDDEYPLIFSGQRSGDRITFKCEVETNVPGDKTQLGPACIQKVTVRRVK